MKVRWFLAPNQKVARSESCLAHHKNSNYLATPG